MRDVLSARSMYRDIQYKELATRESMVVGWGNCGYSSP